MFPSNHNFLQITSCADRRDKQSSFSWAAGLAAATGTGTPAIERELQCLSRSSPPSTSPRRRSFAPSATPRPPASDALASAFADKKKVLKALNLVIEELEVVLRIEATPGMARLLKKIMLPKFRAAVADYNALMGDKLSANRILASFFGAQVNHGWNPNTDTVTVGLTT